MIRKLILWMMILIVAWYSLSAIAHSIRSLLYPYSLDYTEGIVLEFVRRCATGEPLYLDLEKPPWLVFAYTPIYFVINGLILSQSGMTLFWGRLISVLSTLVLAVIAAAIIARSTKRPLLGLLAAALFLTARFVFRWGSLYRPDMLAFALSMTGLYLIMFRRKSWYDVASAFFFVCAVFTKQNHAIGAGAVFLYLIVFERKRLIPFLGALTGFGLTGLIGLQLWSDGLFLNHALRYNLNPFSLDKGIVMGIVMVLRHGIFLFVIMTQRAALWRSGPAGRLLLFYLGIAAVGALSVGKIGSDTNHYLEFSMAIVLCFCLALDSLLSQNTSPSDNYYHLARLVPLLVIFEIVTLSYNNDVISPAYIPDGESRQQISETISWLREQGGDRIFSEDPLLPLLAGKPLVIDPFLIATLVEQGALKPTTAVPEFEQGWFDIVLLKFDAHSDTAYNQWHRERLNENQRNALTAAYAETKTFGPFFFSDSRSDNFWFPRIEKGDRFYCYQPQQ